MRRKLEYLHQGRGGYVVYNDSVGEIQMYFEFGGGNCVAIIDVPSETKWIATTQRPLVERLPILTFIAERAIRDQVRGDTLSYQRMLLKYIRIRMKSCDDDHYRIKGIVIIFQVVSKMHS